MTQNPNISISDILRFCKRKGQLSFFQFHVFFAFCVITFAQIKIYTWIVPQNDRLHLNFVKDEYIVGKKMARNGDKMVIYQLPFICELAKVLCVLRLPFRP